MLSRLLLLALCCWVAPTMALAQDAAQPKKDAVANVDFDKDVIPFLTQYCTSCHGGAKPKGGLDLAKFKDAAMAGKHKNIWESVNIQLRSGEMPPSGKPKPSLAQVEKITQWIDHNLLAFDCTKQRDPGRVTLRRLNKSEYNNTIRDLLGVNFRPADDFPVDDVGYGFDNIGDVLTMSPLLMEKYLKAAEKIVDEVFSSAVLKKRIFVKELPAKATAKQKEETAQAILRPFLKRAYRRPLSDEELGRFNRFIVVAEKNGDNFEKGIQLAITAALCSPHFVFRVERDFRIKPEKFSDNISHFELATRLSYFLWSSMPDDDLFNLAGQGKLRDKGVLENQVRRMLKDRKGKALTENFAGQWLQLRSIPQLSPDPKLFPQFDERLSVAMIRETEMFFEHILLNNRSIIEFLDADWTFVNDRLARHYGLPGVKDDKFVKVQLTGDQRIGLLTQGSILLLTSNPNRTSPVKRGKWILENILNAPPPPPPPEAGDLSEDEKDIRSAPLRKRMEVHRTNAVCASCHNRMDPIGFGFENFDAIGAWRTKDGKFDVDSSGELPGGQKFSGPKQLVAVLKTKEADFRRCLTDKLLTYALGRGLEFYDKCAVDDICAELVREDNRFQALIIAIVRSDPFQMRKGRP